MMGLLVNDVVAHDRGEEVLAKARRPDLALPRPARGGRAADARRCRRSVTTGMPSATSPRRTQQPTRPLRASLTAARSRGWTARPSTGPHARSRVRGAARCALRPRARPLQRAAAPALTRSGGAAEHHLQRPSARVSAADKGGAARHHPGGWPGGAGAPSVLDLRPPTRRAGSSQAPTRADGVRTGGAPPAVVGVPDLLAARPAQGVPVHGRRRPSTGHTGSSLHAGACSGAR